MGGAAETVRIILPSSADQTDDVEEGSKWHGVFRCRREHFNHHLLWLDYSYGDWARSLQDKFEAARTGLYLKTPHLSQRREKLLADPVKELGKWNAWNYRKKVQWRRCKLLCKEISHRLELWGGLLRSIEGHQGTGVLSYFVLLRWLLGFNILLFSLILFIVTIPMAALHTSLSPYSSDAAVNLSDYCSVRYIVDISNDVYTRNFESFQGTGWMEKTLFFYGFYASTEVSFSLFHYSYSLRIAYVLVAMAVLGISLIIMGKSTAESVSRTVIYNASDHGIEYCNKVFGAWDYTMTDEKFAVIKQKSIHYDIASGLADLKFQKKMAKKLSRFQERVGLYFTRILAHNFFCFLLLFVAKVIYIAQEFSTWYTKTHIVANTSKVLILLMYFLPTLTITILNGLLPLLFRQLGKIEEYSLEFVVKITLIRTAIQRLGSLAMLMWVLYKQITCSSKDSCLNIIIPCAPITCWETYVGQQFYKLVVLDTLVGNSKVLLVEFPQRVIYDIWKGKKRIVDKIGPPEFDVAKNVLDLVYTQTLCWLGFFFSPLIPGVLVVSFIILFHMKYLSALYICQPSQRPYRAARSNSFFMVVLLIASFLSCFPVGYTIFSLEPSKMCGPFRTDTKMYAAITDFVAMWPDWLGTIWDIVFYPTFSACAFILLFLVIYYQRKVGNGFKDSSKKLKSQLQMEGRDKQLLMAKIRELTGGSRGPGARQRR